MHAWQIAGIIGVLAVCLGGDRVDAGTERAGGKAAGLKVAVTIKPVHGLVAGVMAGIDSPTLIVEGAASPHSIALKPSRARAIHNSDVLVRVSPTIEPFTEKIVRALPDNVQVVSVASIKGLRLLRLRSGASFETHAHGGEEEDKHNHDHDHGHAHSHDADDGLDGHVWLDPDNAKLIVAHIAQVLGAIRPQHAARFEANAVALRERIDRLGADLDGLTRSSRGKPFIVFHDAYQYFERRFGLTAAGSITVRPDVPPGAKRLSQLRRRIRDVGAACVFAEPQFQARVIETVIEGTSSRSGVLDPLGADLEPGPDLYFDLMRNLAKGFRACLIGAS